ncbi:MAG TPA: phage tail tube protein [Actinomycetes bacterium]|nr:phage tail tube protein [Actinomycetes bacterium]
MPYGSGLSAQLGIAAESTVGTAVTVTKFYELSADGGETLNKEVGWLRAQGLKAGQGYITTARMRQSRFGVAGGLSIFHVDRGVAATGGGMGLWWKHALGSVITTPTQIAATTAYKQIHTPGFKTGLAFTAQVGRPQTDGTVKAHTFRGCKIPSWTFSCSQDELAMFAPTIDGWQESLVTGLATASYPSAAEPFSFMDASTFTLGGTPSTASGETSISGGSAVTTVVTGFSLTGSTPMAVDRRGFGNQGVKREQIENAIPTITGTLTGEYTAQSEFYALYDSGATTALQLDFAKGDAGGSNPFRLSFILPAVKITNAPVNASGPDILGQSIEFEAGSDGTNPVIQVKLVSTDQAL